jgi:hypothetical protein
MSYVGASDNIQRTGKRYGGQSVAGHTSKRCPVYQRGEMLMLQNECGRKIRQKAMASSNLVLPMPNERHMRCDASRMTLAHQRKMLQWLPRRPVGPSRLVAKRWIIGRANRERIVNRDADRRHDAQGIIWLLSCPDHSPAPIFGWMIAGTVGKTLCRLVTIPERVLDSPRLLRWRPHIRRPCRRPPSANATRLLDGHG